MMHVVVCVKQVLDPEVSPKSFRIDAASKQALKGDAKLVFDSFAEYAMEVALQIKDRNPGSKVTALCFGPASAQEVLRRAYALGADDALLVKEETALDASRVGRVLTAAIQGLDQVDLVLCGRQSGDWETGATGAVIAEGLKAAYASLAVQAEPDGSHVKVQREIEGGSETVRIPIPALLTVTNHEKNVPRMPKVKDIMMAARKPIRSIDLAELGVDPEGMPPFEEMLDLYIPTMSSNCELIEGESGEEKAISLVRTLQERKEL